jgi:pimeloyl-ACP methyl ester carboxylesterase
MTTPFAAYSGDSPYVFICYSHADTDSVYQDIANLRTHGLNIWYDEGISPGSEWTEQLGSALSKAEYVLFYMSESSVNSRHCRDEINFAHNHDKPIVSIYLEEVTLPVGLELSLSAKQAIKHFNLSSDAFVEKLKIALPGSVFSDEGTTASSSTQIDKATKQKKPFRLLSVIAALAIIVMVAFLNRSTIAAQLVLNVPMLFFNPIEQQIGFAKTHDDVRIAYATTGKGPPVLIVLGWATHLEEGLSSPTYDNEGLLAMSSEDFTVIRFDGRGFGLSDRNVKDHSIEARVRDIEAVVDTLKLERFFLFGVSSGGQASILYAARNPDKVMGMAIGSSFGSYSHREQKALDDWALMLDLFAVSWDKDAVVDVLIDRLFHVDDPISREIMRTFLRRSANGQNIHDFFMGSMAHDVIEESKTIRVPTLIMHGRDDLTVPLIAGREIASTIPGARFDIVEGGHHEGTGGTVETRKRVLKFFSSLIEAE